MSVSLTITYEFDDPPALDHARLELGAACALEAAGYFPEDESVVESEIEINLCLVDRETSARLNHTYRGKDAATNILSFSSGADVPGLVALGDLVVCLPVVVDEASAQDKSVEDHLLHLVIHGTLHLIGFDHVGEEDAHIMESLEMRVLAGLGVADPYTLPAPDAGQR
jgi:probable rRNA maturation factor